MTPVSLDTSLVVPEDVIFRELDGEAIILNLASGIYFGLDAIGTRMWALFAAYGLVAALTEGSERALIAAAVGPESRGRALGVYNLVSGVGLLAASILAGEVWDHVSPQAALLLGAALAFVAAAVLGATSRSSRLAPAA